LRRKNILPDFKKILWRLLMRNVSIALCLFAAVALAGCAGVNFSQTSPDAENFHPRSIAVLPATVGEYEAARDAVDSIVSRQLTDSGIFDNVVDSAMVRSQMAGSKGLADDMSAYIQKLNGLGVSDAGQTARLKEAFHSDALFLTYVTAWGYGRAGGNKVARVGLGVKLVDAERGTVIWKANHELEEEYWMIRPELGDLSDRLLAMLLDEMPLAKNARVKGRAPEVLEAPAPAPVIEPVSADALAPVAEEDIVPVQQ